MRTINKDNYLEFSKAELFEQLSKAREAIIEGEKVKKELAKNEKKLSLIYDTVGDVVFMIKVEKDSYQFLKVNNAFQVATGIPKEAIEGKKIEEVIPPESIDLVKGNYREAIESKKIIRWDEVSNYPTGTKIGEVTIAPFFNEKDECTYLVGSVHDITERKTAENLLKKSEEKFKGIFDSITDVFSRVKIDGTVEMVSPSVYDMLGFKPEEIIGKKASYFFMTKEERGRMYNIIQEKGYCNDFEASVQKKNGSQIYLSINAKLYKDKHGNPIGIESITRNITERKTAEFESQKLKREFTRKLELKVVERTKDLENAQKKLALLLEKEKELGELKSRFVSMASHQFRTPLTVIQSSITLLELQENHMSNEFKPIFGKIKKRIEEQVNRMVDLMNEVLILGKINAGSIIPQFDKVDVVNLCENVVSNYNEIQNDGRKMDVLVKGKTFDLNLDQQLMENAISNIVSNAFKYSIGKASPICAIEFVNEKAIISIADKGVGIPEQELEHYFSPFFRASNVGDIKGTGLGAAICKEYIELNKGSIQVLSKENRGTEVIITLRKNVS